MEATEGRTMDGLMGRALWRALHKEKVVCPACQKTLSRRALRWRHHCGKVPVKVDLDVKRAALDRKALDGFRARVEVPAIRNGDADGGGAEGAANP